MYGCVCLLRVNTSLSIARNRLEFVYADEKIIVRIISYFSDPRLLTLDPRIATFDPRPKARFLSDGVTSVTNGKFIRFHFC